MTEDCGVEERDHKSLFQEAEKKKSGGTDLFIIIW